MAEIVRMPKSGYTMREGLVSKVLAAEGQRVTKGAPLLEYETDGTEREALRAARHAKGDCP